MLYQLMTDKKVNTEARYAGFNTRALANLIDTVLLLLLTVPLMVISGNLGYAEHPEHIQRVIIEWRDNMISDAEYFRIIIPYFTAQLPSLIAYALIDFIIIGAIFMVFWKKYNSTPGKMLLKIRIVDGKTLEDPTTKQYLLRFIGYFLALIPLGLGFFIIPLNKKKRGLHDFMSGTAVIHLTPLDPEKEKRMFRYKTVFFLTILLIFAIIVAAK